MFFGALFVMVGGLEAAGVLELIVNGLQSMEQIPPVMLGIIIIWVVAGLSAFVDNVPITIALIPVLEGLGASGMNIQPLWWALVFGAGASLAARTNLAGFVDETGHQLDIFVINGQVFVCAKLAKLRAGNKMAVVALATFTTLATLTTFTAFAIGIVGSVI